MKKILYTLSLIIPILFIGSCEGDIPGCTYSWADNYNADANDNDGSCYLTGCTDENALNFNENVTDPQDDDCEYAFPIANVNLFLYPNNPEYNSLNFAGNWAYINGGVNGILIYHNAIDGYIAYDRACTNDPLNSCAQVYVDEESLNTLSCSCCESKYFILDGSVIQGPSVQALHRYRTYFDGVRLDIFN